MDSPTFRGNTECCCCFEKYFPFFFHLPDGGRGGGGVSVGTSSHLDSAVLVVAEPDAGGLPLHLVLATEGAQVLRVLRDLHLLDGLPQGSTIPDVPSVSFQSSSHQLVLIPGAVLSSNSNLLGALRHL